MIKRAFNFTDGKTGASLAVRVIVRAASDHLGGMSEDNVLKIRLMSLTVTAANADLISFFSRRLGIPRTKIEIVAGKNKSNKLVSFEGYSAAGLEEKLELLLE